MVEKIQFLRSDSSVPIFFLGLLLFSLPLSIVGVEFGAVLFAFSFVYTGKWRLLKVDVVTLLVVFLTLINFGWFVYFNFSISSYHTVMHIWYLWLLPLVSVLPWTISRVVYVLRAFVFGLGVNALFGVLQAFGVTIGYVGPQGPMGFTNFHIWLSMMLALGLMVILYSIRESTLIFNRYFSSVLFVLLFWQLFATTGRTGQAVFFVLLPLALWWLTPRIRLFGLIFGIVILTSAALSPVVQHVWTSALLQIQAYRHGEIISSVGLRLVFVGAAWDMILLHPFIGVGAGQFRSVFLYLMHQGFTPTIPSNLFGVVSSNNSFLGYLSEFGLIGFVPFMVILIKLICKAWGEANPLLKYVQILTFCWFVIGSFSDVMVWTWSVMIPFAIIMAMRV